MSSWGSNAGPVVSVKALFSVSQHSVTCKTGMTTDPSALGTSSLLGPSYLLSRSCAFAISKHHQIKGNYSFGGELPVLLLWGKLPVVDTPLGWNAQHLLTASLLLPSPSASALDTADLVDESYSFPTLAAGW